MYLHAPNVTTSLRTTAYPLGASRYRKSRLSTMVEIDSLEKVFDEIGFGRWQGLVLAVAILCQHITPILQLGAPLVSAPVPFRCSYPDYLAPTALTDDTGDTEVKSTENPEWNIPINSTFADDIVEYPSQCLLEVNLADSKNHIQTDVSNSSLFRFTTDLLSCPEIEYDTSIFQSTVITEWNLVCENFPLRPLYQMSFSIGAILGSLFCGHLSDWLGRKRALQVGGLVNAISMVAIGLVPWYSVMIFLRILHGVGNFVLYFPLYTLLSEVSPPRRRSLILMIPAINTFGAMSIFAGIAYLVPHWRKLFLICSSPLLLMVPLMFFLDESPRWLLQKGRAKEAADLLRKAATQNRATISPSTSSLLDKLSQMSKDSAIEKFGGEGKGVEKDDAKSQGSLRILWICFSSPGMRIIMIVLPILWFLKRALYTGIILNANNFTSSNPFEYMAITGAMGIVGSTLSIPMGTRLPRRVALAAVLSITGILSLLQLAVSSDYWWAKWIMVSASFCLVCAAFQLNYISATELFPTVIRSRGFSYINVISSLGEMAIPLVTDILVQYQSWAPSVTFGAAGITASLLLPFLPETKDRPMPETLQDVEDRYWNDYKGQKTYKAVPKDTIILKDLSQEKVSLQV